jgi:hypothetical protein
MQLLPMSLAADGAAGYRKKFTGREGVLFIGKAQTGLRRLVGGEDRWTTAEVIRENLDIGRPSQVQLIFDRWVMPTTRTLASSRAARVPLCTGACAIRPA